MTMGRTATLKVNEAGSDRSRDEGEQTAGQATDDGARHEGQQFPVGRPDSQGGRGDLAGRESAQGSPEPVFEPPLDAAAGSPASAPRRRSTAGAELSTLNPKMLSVGIPFRPLMPPGDTRQLDEDHHEYLTQPDGRQSQIEVAQLEYGPADDQSDDPWDDGADDQGSPESAQCSL